MALVTYLVGMKKPHRPSAFALGILWFGGGIIYGWLHWRTFAIDGDPALIGTLCFCLYAGLLYNQIHQSLRKSLTYIATTPVTFKGINV